MVEGKSWRAAAAAAAMATLVWLSAATAERYTIDSVHSAVGFSIRHLVSRTTGNFTRFAGTIDYDPAFIVFLQSIDTAQ